MHNYKLDDAFLLWTKSLLNNKNLLWCHCYARSGLSLNVRETIEYILIH